MKLLDYARLLKERAEARSRDVHVQENYVRHQESRAAFERALSKLTVIEGLSRATREAAIGAVTTADDHSWALEIAQKLEHELGTASGHELDHLARQAESAVDIISERANRRFEDVVERWGERQSLPSDHVVDLLGMDAPEAADRTRQCARRLRRLLADPPRDPEAIAQLAEAARNLEIAYASLAGSAPDAVGDFLEKAPVGVSLDDVNPTVIEWLRDKGIASSFTVRLRR